MTKTTKEEVYKDEWITIYFEEQKPKTKVFSVWSNCQDLRIGDVVYDNGWRHYVFDDGYIKLSDRCLLALNQFVSEQNKLSNKSYNKGYSQSEVDKIREVILGDARDIIKENFDQLRKELDIVNIQLNEEIPVNPEIHHWIDQFYKRMSDRCDKFSQSKDNGDD